VAVLNLVLDFQSTGVPLDAVILTRFDTQFRSSLAHLVIDWGQVNIAFRDGEVYWRKEQKVSDLFHVFPVAHTRALRDAFAASRTGTGHTIYRHLARSLGEQSLRFIDDGKGRGSNVAFGDPDPTFLFIDRSCEDFSGHCGQGQGDNTRCQQSVGGRRFRHRTDGAKLVRGSRDPRT